MCRRKQWMAAVLLATLTAVLTACGSAKSSADTASVATYDTEAAMVEDTDYFSDGTYDEVTYDEGESGTDGSGEWERLCASQHQRRGWHDRSYYSGT